MRVLIAFVIAAVCAYAQLPKPGGGGGGGGGGTPPYEASFSAATTVSVTAATHGKGVNPIVEACYDNSTPRQSFAYSATFPTAAANGDVVVTWSGSKTGKCYISAGDSGGTGATGATGATGIGADVGNAGEVLISQGSGNAPVGDNGLAFNTTTNSLGVIGNVTIGQTGTATGELKINGTTSGTVTVKTGDAAGTWTLTLPGNDGGSNECLITNGSGVTSWGTCGAGGGASTYPDLTTWLPVRTDADTLTIACSATDPCAAKKSDGTVALFTSDIVLDAITGSGTVRIYYNPTTNTVHAGRSASVSSITCTGCTSTGSIEDYPVDTDPIYSWGVSSSVLDATGTEARPMIGGYRTEAGTGLTRSGRTIAIDSTVVVNAAGTATDDRVLVGNGSAWQEKALPDCDDTGGSHLNYDTATNTFTCGTSGGAGGGVTSVAQTFTGGLISVAGSPITTSGTLALTVAGTSGGVPYFSSSSAWASSAALGSLQLVYGGGAGAAPATSVSFVVAGAGTATPSIQLGTSGYTIIRGDSGAGKPDISFSNGTNLARFGISATANTSAGLGNGNVDVLRYLLGTGNGEMSIGRTAGAPVAGVDLTVRNATAASPTAMALEAGATQGTTALLTVRDYNATPGTGTILTRIMADGALAFGTDPADAQPLRFANNTGAGWEAATPGTDLTLIVNASDQLAFSGQQLASNLGLEFAESDTNPTCAAGNFTIYADLSENKLKKCVNGSASDLDTTGGTPAFSDITGATNTTAAMVVGTGASLTVSGSGTINATSLGGTAAASYALLNSPSFTTPTLGVATATSVNKVAITAPATSATLTIADGKTLTVSNTLTFTGTDSSSVAFGAGGTVVYTATGVTAASTFATDNSCLRADGTSRGAQASSTNCTIDDSGNMTVASITTAGSTPFLELPQGTASAASANSVRIIPPTSITTAYRWIMPAGVGATGVLKGSVSSNDATLSLAAIADADVPDNITITLAATATALASDPTACTNQVVTDIAANGTLTCATVTDAHITSTLDLGGKTSFELPNGAAPTVDAFGEIAGDNDLWGASRGAPVFYDGTAAVALVGILTSDTCANGEVAKFNTGGTWTCEADATGGTAAWDSLTAPTGAVSLVSNGTSETVTIDFQAAFTTGSQFVVKSSTGNPSGGVLAEVLGHDADVTLLKITNGGSNGVQVSAAGALTAIGTGAITATDGDSATSFFSSGTIEAGRLPSASDTASGISELATSTETTTGTDTGRAITPDGLSASDYGLEYIGGACVADATALTVADGKCYFGPLPAKYNGWTVETVVVGVGAAVSSSGAVTVDIDRCGVVATGVRCSGTNVSIFSTLPTIDANEDSTSTAATASVINGSNDDLTTDQWFRVNVDGAGTGTQGLYVLIGVRHP